MRALRVEQADCLVLVEDLGRPGYAHLGVPRSGALDKVALALANRLVGNPEDHAVLEVLVGGVRLLAQESVRIALTGAQLPMVVGGRPAPWGTAVSVAAGSLVEVGPGPGGLRSWLAVAGGIDVPTTLGSRSTDSLSGLGPAALKVGDLVPVGPATPHADGSGQAAPARPLTGRAVLRLRLGPRDDWFTDASLAALLSGWYDVSPSSNRVALRLRGDPLARRAAGELASEGIVDGAIQVPGDGQPLIFLADHPTTGGYPVVGVILDDDLAWCAQLRPGDRVRFMPAT
ncbi:MAG: hypothetical protein QOI06_1225 [Nocardioidaceae bacterium]|nr:hypothetical protein [Nocardioidaceae bacterium]